MSTTNTTSTPNRDLNQILDEANVQSFMSKNKTALLAVLVLLIGAVIGFGFYMNYADKSKAEYNSDIHLYESTVLKDFSAKATDATLAKKVEVDLKTLHSKVGDYIGLLPIVLKASDLLAAGGFFLEAKNVISIGEEIASEDYAQYFVLSRKAAILEDLKEDKNAIEALEKLTSLTTKIFEGKTYLDLGRLYLKAGDKEKAKKNFTYVVEKAKDEAEFVKIAQLYLSKM